MRLCVGSRLPGAWHMLNTRALSEGLSRSPVLSSEGHDPGWWTGQQGADGGQEVWVAVSVPCELQQLS